jgi:hypothetical protein
MTCDLSSREVEPLICDPQHIFAVLHIFKLSVRRDYSNFMLSFVMLSVIMQSFVMLNVVMPSVVASNKVRY